MKQVFGYLILAIVFILAFSIINVPDRQSASIVTPIPDVEEIFLRPRKISWEATVISCVAGCEGYALKMLHFQESHQYFQMYDRKDSMTILEPGQKVKVNGQWTGITCAYAQSLFEGHCTPEVLIDSIEILE